MKPLLITGDGCPNCTIAKDYIKEHKLDIEIVHLDERPGRDAQMKYGIRGIPTLIERDENGEELHRQVGKINFSEGKL